MLHLYWHKTGQVHMCGWMSVCKKKRQISGIFRASRWLKCWVLWEPCKKQLTDNIRIGQHSKSHIPNVRWLIKETLSPAQSKQWAEASHCLTSVKHSTGLSWSEYFHCMFMCVRLRERNICPLVLSQPRMCLTPNPQVVSVAHTWDHNL